MMAPHTSKSQIASPPMKPPAIATVWLLDVEDKSLLGSVEMFNGTEVLEAVGGMLVDGCVPIHDVALASTMRNDWVEFKTECVLLASLDKSFNEYPDPAGNE